jgi:hypothetical protein
MAHLEPWLAVGVLLSTAATDAVYVMFNAAVSSQRRLPAATWSSVWYLLSAFAVISYTKNWVYVCFAAVGSWIGAYVSMTVLRRAKGPRGPEAVYGWRWGGAVEDGRPSDDAHISKIEIWGTRRLGFVSVF